MNAEQRAIMVGLADYLASGEIPPEQFDMGLWHCGTRACAIGHGIIAGKLPGLEFRSFSANFKAPLFNDRTAFHAIANYFDIPLIDAEYLFDGTSLDYPQNREIEARDVGALIRDYLANGMPDMDPTP